MQEGGGGREWAAVVERVLHDLDLHRPWRLLVDGRSGTGKTTLASLLERRTGAQVVHLDDIYPGWGGLEAAARHVSTCVLDPRRPRWRRWDWHADRPAEWHFLDPDGPLIVEGVGALTRASRDRADFGVWLDCPDAVRKRLALARDGEAFALHWDEWAAEEVAFLRREDPLELADAVISSPLA